MAFPVVETTATGGASGDVTTYPAALPAGIAAGNLIVVIVGLNSGVTPSFPGGWTTSLYDAGTRQVIVGYKVATGGETSVDVSLSGAGEDPAHTAYRISGHGGVSGVSFGVGANGADASPDPPSVTAAGGLDDNLFIAFGASVRTGATAPPTNYSPLLTANSTGVGSFNQHTFSAARSLASASDNPGAFTLGAGRNWVARALVIEPGVATSTGTMAVTEAADVLAATGEVPASGTIAATEAADTLSATGVAAASGALDATEAPDALSASGSAAFVSTGALAVTETPDTLSAAGTVPAAGALAVTETQDALSGTGKVRVSGAMAVTEAPDDFAGSNELIPSFLTWDDTGTITWDDGGSTVNWIDSNLRLGQMAATEASNTFAATGIAPATGALAATDAPDTLSATGVAPASGVLDATEPPDALDATGVVISGSTGVLDVTEGQDGLTATGKVPTTGALAATEDPDTLTATGIAPATGALVATEDPDTFAATGLVLVSGSVVITDAPDTFVGTGKVLVSGTMAATDQPDTVLGFGGPPVSTGTMAVTEPLDTLAATGSVPAAGVLSAIEVPDLFDAAAVAAATGAMDAIDTPDLFSGSGSIGWPPAVGFMDVTEDPDVLQAGFPLPTGGQHVPGDTAGTQVVYGHRTTVVFAGMVVASRRIGGRPAGALIVEGDPAKKEG